MIEIGTYVTIHNASLGWGDVHSGQVGCVTGHSSFEGQDTLILDIPAVQTDWACRESDVSIAEIDGAVEYPLKQYVQVFTQAVEERIEQANSMIRSEKRTMKTMQTKLDHIIVPNDKAVKTMQDQLESFNIRNNVIVFVTKNIVIPYTTQDGVDYRVQMGQYKVKLDITVDHISIKFNHTQDHTRSGYMHPHINSDGNACWGTYDTVLFGLIDQMDIVGVVSLILDFLNSCDRSGWYISVLNWVNGYDQCYYCESEYCECNEENEDWCGECDTHQDDCQCTRCPDSYERLEGNQFPDNGCSSCMSLVRNLQEEQWQCTYDSGDYPHFDVPLNYMSVPTGSRARFTTIDENGNESDHPNVQANRER